MRLFLAIELEPQVRAAAAAAGHQVRARVKDTLDARWIREENLHITLWFIGEVADDRVPALLSALDVPFGVAPFDLSIGGAGAFPPSGPPRVLWLGGQQGTADMVRLYGHVAERLEPLGYERERRAYSPHLTIARVRESRRRVRPAEVRALISGTAATAGVSRVNAVTLFRSRLSPKGASYEPVLRVPLQG